MLSEDLQLIFIIIIVVVVALTYIGFKQQVCLCCVAVGMQGVFRVAEGDPETPQTA